MLCVPCYAHGGQRGEVLPEGAHGAGRRDLPLLTLYSLQHTTSSKRGESCHPLTAWKKQKRWAGEAWLWCLRRLFTSVKLSFALLLSAKDKGRGDLSSSQQAPLDEWLRGLSLAWLTGWNLGGGLLPAAGGTHPEAWESTKSQEGRQETLKQQTLFPKGQGPECSSWLCPAEARTAPSQLARH